MLLLCKYRRKQQPLRRLIKGQRGKVLINDATLGKFGRLNNSCDTCLKKLISYGLAMATAAHTPMLVILLGVTTERKLVVFSLSNSLTKCTDLLDCIKFV